MERSYANKKLYKMKKIIWNKHQEQTICHKELFDDDLVVIQKSKITINLKKAAYVGMFILDLSKVLFN